METMSQTYFVVRVRLPSKEGTNTKPIWRYVSSKYNSEHLTDRIEEATQFSDVPVQDLIKVYQSCLRRYPAGDVGYFKMEVIHNIDSINLNEGQYLEERRRVALGKLVDDDIKALGIEELSVYNKLRYHSSKT